MRKNKDTQKEKQGFAYTVRDMLCEKPNIEISDNTLATVEGSRGVLEYSENVIKINLGAYVAVFSGRGLNLKCISPTALVIEGVFSGVEFSV